MTGATGVLGKRVLKLLQQADVEVKALARSEANEKVISDSGDRMIKWKELNKMQKNQVVVLKKVFF